MGATAAPVWASVPVGSAAFADDRLDAITRKGNTAWAEAPWRVTVWLPTARLAGRTNVAVTDPPASASAEVTVTGVEATTTSTFSPAVKPLPVMVSC